MTENNPTPNYYNYEYKGIKVDPYRIMQIYNITHPAHQHALKKLLRAGRGEEDLISDITGVVDSLVRWLEMIQEDDNEEINFTNDPLQLNIEVDDSMTEEEIEQKIIESLMDNQESFLPEVDIEWPDYIDEREESGTTQDS